MIVPVIIFVYNRLETLKKTIESLLRNDLAAETDIYIYSDGARNDSDIDAVDKVRCYIHTISGFKKVYIINRDKNYGLANNIVDGVSTLLKHTQSVIVLEDDIVTAPFFLKFMNDALEIYSDDDKVCQISGYSYLESIGKDLDLDDIYFVRGADCLAWGTWRRAWLSYTGDSGVLIKEIQERGLIYNFNRDNSYNYYKMLQMSEDGKTVSWAVNWYAVNFLAERYILYPLKSLALHVGTDNTATNYIYIGTADPYNVPLYDSAISVAKIPVIEKKNTKKALNIFLRKSRGTFIERFNFVLHMKIMAMYSKFIKKLN